jgi:hypothetical protein
MSGQDRKRLFIVGNGPLPRDMSAEIDSADFVVRFNEPKASIGMSGTKTDWLFLNNCGKPMQRRVENPAYVESPIVKAARWVFFAYHPIVAKRYQVKPNILSRLKGRRADWTGAALDMFGRAGKEVVILPSTFYEEGCAELGIPKSQMTKVFPSTGYFGIRYVLREFPSDIWEIHLCGFTWEGWKRHAWGDERRWVQTMVKERAITIWTPEN